MPHRNTTKLRRAENEAPPTVSESRDTGKFDTPGDGSWRGFDLAALGQSLTQTHIPKVVWRHLVDCISQAVGDQAVALVQGAGAPLVILAQDGAHDSLLADLACSEPLCPFGRAPNQIIADLSTAPGHEQARVIYEFIEHFWGWTVGDSAEGEPIHLMMFGADAQEPTEQAHDARRLARFVVESVASEKSRRQLISELSAETQGLRISSAAALRAKIDQWLGQHDD